jgi:hypothetical protein
MPNFFSPLLPTFGVDKDFKSGLKKAETYLIGYAVAITIARKIPSTAGPIGFALGLNIVPGKGISIKPLAVPLVYAPQPIGVMPPHYYHLPDIMGEPLDLAKILAKPNRKQLLIERIDRDYAIRDAEIVAKQKQSVKELTDYERQIFTDLTQGRIPAAPTPQQLLNIDRLNRSERLLAALESETLGVMQQLPDGRLFVLDPYTGKVLLVTADKAGGPAGFFVADQNAIAGLMGNGQVFPDGFFAKNPADP